MAFAGFAQGANAGIQGANNMNSAQINQSQLQEMLKQAQAKALLTKVLQQYAGGQQGGQAPQGGPMGGAMPQMGPTNPGMPQMGPTNPGMPQPSGVSPQGGGMPPAGVAPGGAGPSSPMGGAMPQQGALGGINMQALVQALSQSGGSDGAQGYALQDMMKMLQPQANNAIKLDIAGQRDDTTRRGQDIRAQTADRISQRAAARMTGNADKGLLKEQLADNKAEIDSLIANKTPKEQLAVMSSAEYQALKKERAELYSQVAKGGSASGDASAQTSHPITDDMKNDPDGTQYPAQDGKMWMKQGDVLVPAS